MEDTVLIVFSVLIVFISSNFFIRHIWDQVPIVPYGWSQMCLLGQRGRLVGLEWLEWGYVKCVGLEGK